MIAKRLETLVGSTVRCNEAEIVQRFQKLRDVGLLPTSRGKNADHLTSDQIVSGILSVVSARPGFAGVTTKFIRGLHPVGGVEASFGNAGTFGQALACLFADESLLACVREVRVSDSEIYTNSCGRAAIFYREGKQEKTAYYVRKDALSLMQKGAEITYDPRDLISDAITEIVFFPRLFQQIAREVIEHERFTKLAHQMSA